jgi:methylase of polypeptide subunit release factors
VEVVEDHEGLRIVSDDDADDRDDGVQGVTAAARTLANLLVPRPVGTALDLGCGSGLLALTLARTARRVVGTDVNPRAVELARRSAALSGVRNAEFRAGDWYEPVRGERFDLIACNPPYVVSPETRLVYRDGSDATAGVVRGAAEHLVPGGLAQLLVNWAHPADDWAGPLRGWIPAGCDALVVHHASMRPRQYADTWAAAERVADWLDWYREQGIEAIGAAFLLLRRRDDDGPPRMQALEAASAPTPRAGVHVERLLRGADLASGDDDALAALRLAVVDGVRVAGTTRRRGGAWVPGEATVSVVPTVGVQAAVAGEDVELLWRLDGSAPLGELLGDRRAEGLALARRLLELGLAEPR